MADRKIDLIVAVALVIAFFGAIIFMYFINTRLGHTVQSFVTEQAQCDLAHLVMRSALEPWGWRSATGV